MRTSGTRARLRWLAPVAALSMLGCPKQELAPLGPCTVSAVREDVNQTGVSEVDLLFVIDNSLSMATEQANLNAQLPRLIRVLTSGDRYVDRTDVPPGITDEERFFTPVSSLHLGVITSELGVMRAPLPGWANSAGLGACASDPASDDGRLQTSTTVATMGDTAVVDGQTTRIVANPECGAVDPQLDYLAFDTKDKSEEQLAEGSAQTALEFGCISTVGVKGCAFEQQLEAMLKAVAPSTQNDFIGSTSRGHGNPNGENQGFVRDNAILAIVQVTDEEDCSIKDGGQVLFETQHMPNSTSNDRWARVPLNLRCGQAAEEEDSDLIQPARRYIDGLKALKPDNPDRVIFAGIVGIPDFLEEDVAAGRYEEVLAHQNMQFAPDPVRQDLPKVSCSVTRPGATIPDVAYPPRRFVEVAAGFGPENAALFSICRDTYEPAVNQIIERIASKLKGNCLPRRLTPDDDGLVRCEVYELLAADVTSCKAEKGHLGSAEKRKVSQNGMIVERLACRVRQVTVDSEGTPVGEGWYYDSFSPELMEECSPGEQQRIVFTQRATLDPGSGATFECFQPVQSITANARGFDAINTRCDEDPDICGDRSDDDSAGYNLICIEELRTCQAECRADPDCPPGWVCANLANDSSGGDKFCQQPTCQTGPSEDTPAAEP